MCLSAILSAEQLRLIREGVPERNFGGLAGFFRWLERRKYKMHLRVFTNRWRSASVCPTCHGKRLNEEALAWRIGGLNIAEVEPAHDRRGDRVLWQICRSTSMSDKSPYDSAADSCRD